MTSSPPGCYEVVETMILGCSRENAHLVEELGHIVHYNGRISITSRPLEIEIEARRTFAADKQPDALLLGVLLELRVRHDLAHDSSGLALREREKEKDVDGAGKQQSWSRKQTEDGRSFKSRDPMNGRAFSHLISFDLPHFVSDDLCFFSFPFLVRLRVNSEWERERGGADIDQATLSIK